VADPWWRSFFAGGWAEIHSEVIPAERTAEHVEVISRLLHLEAGAHVLDVPCGDGRIALPLAERGMRVTGVELNERLLDCARAEAAARRVDVEWRPGDMRDLTWDGEFDAAACFSGSFGYFDDDGNATFARAVHRALKPGGRFLVDTHVAETVLPIFAERSWDRVGDMLVVQERRLDHEAGRIDSEWTFVREGSVQTNEVSIRLYTYRELAELLRACGFKHVESYGPDGEPFAVPGSRRLHAVATA
jgi:SAM-dependent methyltransferase